jgi:hypothetical protein
MNVSSISIGASCAERRSAKVDPKVLHPLPPFTTADLLTIARQRDVRTIARSIRDIGILAPVVLAEVEDGDKKRLYILAGNRRVAACAHILDLPEVPAIIIGGVAMEGLQDFAASLIGENIVKGEKWPSLPWCDCKVAFGVDDWDAIEKISEPAWSGRLPTGWTHNETDGTGGRIVVVFRVRVPLREEDGEYVVKLLQQMGATNPKRKG